MPRTFPAAITTAIQSTAFALATLIHIEFPDGSVTTLTDWGAPLSVDLLGAGALTYSPARLIGLTGFSAQINGPIDDCDLVVMVDGATFVADDIRRGAYDNSVVTVGYVVPTDLANPVVHRKYDVGQASIEGLKITLELMGPEKRLEQPVGRTLSVNCPWTFGDLDCGLSTRVNPWVATTAYAVGTIVRRITGTGIYWFKATVAGTSGASEPAWPGTLGGTVTDGTVTWTAMRARRLTGTVTSSANRRTVVATGITVVNDYFGEGFLTFLTGANAGDTRRVKTDNGAGTLTLHLAAFDNIAVGDTFEIVVGCRKRITEDCKTKHSNVLRFGGFPFLAEENVTATAPKG